MRIVLDVLRFREDFLPSEDRYEYSLVVQLGGELMEIPITEDQLKNALKEHAHLVGQGPAQVDEGIQGLVGQQATKEPPEQGIYIENGLLFQDGVLVPGDTRIQLDDETTVTAQAFVTGQGHEHRYIVADGAIMEPPSMFQDEEDHTFAAEAQDGLEEPLEFDTTGGEVANELVADLLNEGAGPPMVDEIIVGAEPTAQLPNQEPDTSAVFGAAPEPEQQAVRRDMTPPSKKRLMGIKNRIAKRKNNPHQQKLQDMRDRAKRHPMRSGPGADEVGNPLIHSPRPRTGIPQAPAYVPGAPTIKHVAPVEPTVEDEDGFPSA